jgi:hypothetical protein
MSARLLSSIINTFCSAQNEEITLSCVVLLFLCFEKSKYLRRRRMLGPKPESGLPMSVALLSLLQLRRVLQSSIHSSLFCSKLFACDPCVGERRNRKLSSKFQQRTRMSVVPLSAIPKRITRQKMSRCLSSIKKHVYHWRRLYLLSEYYGFASVQNQTRQIRCVALFSPSLFFKSCRESS